ncbi:MAG: GNAT family protein [Gemmatimonadota bacterium]
MAVPPMQITPVTLDGHHVRLAPMSESHLEGLSAAGLDESIWRLAMDRMQTRQDVSDYVTNALADQARGVSLPFVTIDRASNRIIGSTRFGNIDRSNRRVEIGWTWLNPQWQRTAANTEAKLMMLQHAFDIWDCVRVELKTDALNQQSRDAMLRIGAREEGVLRSHMLAWNGRRRDSVYFSILDHEWPAVKASLESKLVSGPAAQSA